MIVEGVHFGEREGRASGSGFRKVLLLLFFFNIVLTWKIVGASKAFVLYVYIDLKHISDINIFETRVS